MSLQQLFRPKTFKGFVGNETTIEALQQVLQKDPPNAFLFTGGPGTGKTSLGRVVARELGCHKADFVEKDSADDRSIDSIRKMKEDLKAFPFHGKKKVVLLDEAHQMLKPAQSALLKILEEPPNHAHIILCTTNPESLLDTIKRRCHIYELDALTSTDLHKLFKRILKKEKIKNYSKTVLSKIIELSNGSAGSALKYLDMVIDFTDETKALSTLKSAGTAQSDVIDICRTLCDQNMSKSNKWHVIKRMLKNFKGDAEAARRPILGYLSTVLLSKDLETGIEISFMIGHFEKNFYDSGISGLKSACFRAISELEE
jgi:DNA polymerase III gamma/tau subunit